MIDHSVLEVLRAVEGLLRGGAWIGERPDEADGEVLVDLPVAVGVEFARQVLAVTRGRARRADRA